MEQFINSKIREIDSLFNQFDFIHHQIAIKQGLSDCSFRILRAILILGEGCNQTNIYKSICINKQTVNSSIKQLVKNEIIYFKSGKGRENKIYLTDKGKKVIETKIIPIENIETKVVEELTEQEYYQFINIANKYIRIFNEKVNLLINEGGK